MIRSLQMLSFTTLLCVSALSHAANYPPEQVDEAPPVDDLFGITPIAESFDYVVAVSQPPILNPGPNPTQIGNSLLSGSYVDQFGALYDLRVDLTTGVARIFNGSSLVGQGGLTASEVDLIRRSGENIEGPQAAQCGPICVGIVVAVVGVAITVAYEEYRDYRDCQRQVASNWNALRNEQAACHRSGGVYRVSTYPSSDTCGGGYGSCDKN